MRGAFLDCSTLGTDELDFSKLAATLPQWDFYDTTAWDEIPNRIQTVDIVVTNKVPLTRELFDKAPSLKCICVAATGYDQIDITAAKERGVVVSNVVHYSTASVIQHTIGLLLNLSNNISRYDTLVKAGAWAQAKQFCLHDFPLIELQDKVLGVIGYGSIGQGVANVAQALGMKIITAESTFRARVDTDRPLETVLREADFLTLHCPLSEHTRGLIGHQELAMMKPQAYIINTARGGLIDEAALAQALLSNRLAGAALDVLSKEPPHSEHPLLQEIPNLILTPHVAWATREARQRLLNGITENVQAFVKGDPIHVVN